MPRRMRRLILTFTPIMLLWTIAQAQSDRGVTLIDNPGGGTIAYAQMPAQHTLRDAIGRVLQYVHTRFGSRPQITRVLKGADGSSVAVIFTVKALGQSSQDIAGLAMVAVSASAPAKGAVLTDQADRFRSTVGPMLKHLQSGAGLTGTDGGPMPPAASPPSGSGATAPAASSAAAQSAAAQSAAATLHQTAFPDGSGSIGLPDGWSITGAHAGEVVAQGPGSAGLHFDWQISAVDPNDPRSRGMRGGGAGSPVAIPYGTDGANTYKAAITQFLQKQGKSPPTIDVVDSKRLSAQESMLVASIGAIDGRSPMRALIDIGISPLNPLGGYLITLYVVSFPQQLGQQSLPTAAAILHSYKVNDGVAVAQIRADAQRSQAFTQGTLAEMNRRQDAQDRQFQAFDNNLLDRTVIRDTYVNGHGTVSNDLADALVDANPDRFQEVPPSEYVKGIDY